MNARMLALGAAAAFIAAARATCDAQNESQLAKEAQNPVADLASVPFQFNYYMAGGLESRTSLVLNVQPVLPLSLNRRWLLIARTIIPYVSVPMDDGTRRTGIGDIQEQFYFTPKKAEAITWGVGPVLSVPTATNELAHTGQWALGPTAVVILSQGRWMVGALANNIWRLGGVDHGPPINQLVLQPLVFFNIPPGWAIASAPLITSNWSAPAGQRWTVPLGLGLTKLTVIGRQPVSLGMHYYRAVQHPDAGGADQFRFVVNLLYPVARR